MIHLHELSPALRVVVVCFASICSGIVLGVLAFFGLTAVTTAVNQSEGDA